MDTFNGWRARERGQAVPVVLALVVVAALGAVGLARLGVRAVDAARARTAADAAALAGAVDGQPAARRLAAANGGVLESFDHIGDDVVVVVRVGGAEARARAGVTIELP